MSNEDDRKRRLAQLLATGATGELIDEAEALALLFVETGTLLSDEAVEKLALALLLSTTTSDMACGAVTARAERVLAQLHKFNVPALPPLKAVCTECGRLLPHEKACEASSDPEACS